MQNKSRVYIFGPNWSEVDGVEGVGGAEAVAQDREPMKECEWMGERQCRARRGPRT